MKTLIFASVFFLFSLFRLSAQQSGNIIYQKSNRYEQNAGYNTFQWKKSQNAVFADQTAFSEKMMEFDVKVLMNVKAETYLAIFNMTQVAETAQKADEMMSARFKSFKDEMMQKGISENDIFLDMISLIPVYEYELEKKLFSRTYQEVPKGFELQKNIHIRYKDPKILDRVLTIAAKNEIYDLIKVEYFVDNTEAVYDTLRDKAAQIMNKKIATFRSLHIDLDTIYHVVTDDKFVAFPVDRYRSYQAYSSTSLDAAKSKADIKNVQKPKSMFYNKVPYHGFDAVINPVIIEPSVQYAYHLKLRYIVKSPEKTKETKYYLIKPDGSIKLLDIK